MVGFVTVDGRAGGVRTLLQPARAQCLRLSERFFHSKLLLDNSASFTSSEMKTCVKMEGKTIFGVPTG